jgi:N-acylneuraminate cytidylyltransferase
MTMKNGKKIVALIPLRGGSKSIPLKNVKEIAGKPLFGWVLESVKAISEIDEIYVSTEDREIAEIVTSQDSTIHILRRPSELATDEASTESVMLHFAENVEFDILITIQATSPLTQPEDINKGLEKFFSDELNSIVTGVRMKRFFWNSQSKPLNYDYRKRPRRQDFEGLIMENGAFYITDRSTLLKTQCRLGGKIGVLEMPKDTGVEIDDPSDWILVEKLLNDRKRKNLTKIVRNIKILVVDVDGTLTDAGMYYSEQGELLKKFNTRDAKGLELVQKKGISLVILTSENSEIVNAKTHKLKLKNVFLGIKNKLSVLENFMQEENVTYAEVAYIGDDINDLPAIKKVGFSACPSNSVPQVKEAVTYVSNFKGGEGAVREICDLFLINTLHEL